MSPLFLSDVRFPLPEGWPKIPQLFVRRSWNFTTAISPSVNKAISHLELLQNTLEDWAKEVEKEILTEMSSGIRSRVPCTSPSLESLRVYS